MWQISEVLVLHSSNILEHFKESEDVGVAGLTSGGAGSVSVERGSVGWAGGFSFVRVVMVLICGCLLLGLCGCDSRKTAKVSKPEEMYKAIKEIVPQGTALAVAEKTMTNEGFTVEKRQDGKWKGRESRHLYCLREDGQIIKRRWEFALFYDTQTVTGVDLRTGLVLP